MSKLMIPKGYNNPLSYLDTEIAIKIVKDQFEKRLAAKGIVCKNRVSHLPPKAEYAQIINTSDYDMKTEVETFKAERRSGKGESKKQHRNE